MIWILGLIAVLVAGVLLANFLLSNDPPQRKTRPPLVWGKDPRVVRRRHAAAGVPASAPSSDMDAAALFPANAYWSPHSAADSSSDCDTGADSSGGGDCGSDGGGFD